MFFILNHLEYISYLVYFFFKPQVFFITFQTISNATFTQVVGKNSTQELKIKHILIICLMTYLLLTMKLLIAGIASMQ